MANLKPPAAPSFPRRRPSLVMDLSGNVCVLYWLRAPEAEDLPGILADAQAARLIAARPLLQFVLFHDLAHSMPGAAARKALSDSMKSMDENFHGYVMVLGGSGFVAAALHAFSSTLALVGARKPGRTRIVATLDQGIEALRKLDTIDADALRACVERLKNTA
jgi:hypothetical protein